MSDNSAIEWTEATWSPVTGCTKVSDGCTHCYIDRTPPFRMAGRRFNGTEPGSTTGVKLHSDRVGIPLKWRKPRRIFVCSLADLFQDEVPDRFIADVFATMARASHHTFQVLTKRHARMRSLLGNDGVGLLEATTDERTAAALYEQWPLPNVWLGVSVENQKWADIRVPALLDTPAAVRWLSCEPLLGPVDLRAVPGLGGQYGHAGRHNGIGTPECPRISHHHHDERCRFPIDWVVVGGESGHGARPMHPDWARGIRDACAAASVPFFFKQWGEWLTVRTPSGEHRERVGKKRAGRELDGRTWDEYPAREARDA